MLKEFFHLNRNSHPISGIARERADVCCARSLFGLKTDLFKRILVTVNVNAGIDRRELVFLFDWYILYFAKHEILE